MLKINKALLFTSSMLASSYAFGVCEPADINGTWRFFIVTERFTQGQDDVNGHQHEFARCRIIIADGQDAADPIKVIDNEASTCTGFNVSGLTVSGSFRVQGSCTVRGSIDLATEVGDQSFRLQAGLVTLGAAPGLGLLNIDKNSIAGIGQVFVPGAAQGDPEQLNGKFSYDAVRVETPQPPPQTP